MLSLFGSLASHMGFVLGASRTGFVRNRLPHRTGRARLTLARETMRYLEDREINLVECGFFAVLARTALEEHANRAFLQFLLRGKSDTPEVLAWVKHFDPVEIPFRTNAGLSHYAADGFLAAANPLQVNLLAWGQGLFQKEATTIAADIHRLHNSGEVHTCQIRTRDLDADRDGNTIALAGG